MKTLNGISALKAHIALNVTNVAKSIEFYSAMLGIEPSKVRRGYAKFDVANPPLNLTLNEVPFGERGALSHLGIQVGSTDDVLAVREGWREAGLKTHDEMGTNCCYAIQDKTWVHDPDGNEWEVFVVLQDNLIESTVCCVPGESGIVCATPEVAETKTDVKEKVATAPAAATMAAATAVAEGACCIPIPGSGCC